MTDPPRRRQFGSPAPAPSSDDDCGGDGVTCGIAPATSANSREHWTLVHSDASLSAPNATPAHKNTASRKNFLAVSLARVRPSRSEAADGSGAYGTLPASLERLAIGASSWRNHTRSSRCLGPSASRHLRHRAHA